jgi:hypothetical protein
MREAKPEGACLCAPRGAVMPKGTTIIKIFVG